MKREMALARLCYYELREPPSRAASAALKKKETA